MNRFLRHSLIFLATWQANTGAFAQGSLPEQIAVPLKPLQPGLLWRVESLPESQRTRWKSAPSAQPKEKPEASDQKSAIKIIEENWIGKNFRKQILKQENAKDTIRYSVDGYVLVQKSKDEFFMTIPSEEEGGRPLPVDKLEGFEWIKPQRLAGMAVVDGERCAVYVAPWPIGNGNSSALQTTSVGSNKVVLAAISVTDHLPRRLEDPLSIRRYRFGQSANPPTLPPEVEATRQKFQDDLRKELRRHQIPQ